MLYGRNMGELTLYYRITSEPAPFFAVTNDL